MENLKQLFFYLYEHYSVILQVVVAFFIIIGPILFHKNRVLQRKLKKLKYELAKETAERSSLEQQNIVLTRKYASSDYNIRNLNQQISKLSLHNETLQQSLRNETLKYNELASKVNNEKILREQKRQFFFRTAKRK